MTTNEKKVNQKPSLLFSPFTVRGVTLKNRICVSPMVTWQAVDGKVNDFHLAHYGQFALGGVGMIMSECTSVEKRGRIAHSDAGLWSDDHIEPWLRVTKLIKSLGSVPAVQLHHAGRKASTHVPWSGQRDSIADDQGGWPTIAPSSIAFGGLIWKAPNEASLDDILVIQQAFESAAVRAIKAGFEVIELHMAHGYLINQFLSPATNKRSDKYGGSLENRMRFGLEIAQRVRQAIPADTPLFVRISVTDFVDNGWDESASVEFARRLRSEAGVDVVDCSSGGLVDKVDYNCYNTPDVQHKASALIQREANIPTTAVGKIVDPLKAEELLQSKSASLIFIGRALLNNPHWAFMAADQLAADQTFKYHDSYDWCIGWKGFYKWRQLLQKDLNNN